MPYPPNLCASVQSVGVFVGGYGIPAIPTPPSEFLPQNPFQVCLRKSSHRIHRIHRSFWRRIFSHRFHRIHRSFWRRRASHGFHRCTQMVRLRRVLPRNSRNPQKFLAEKSLPRISQMYTDFSSPPVVSVFREFCGKIVWWLRGYGRMPYPPNLCISVQSVGEYLAPETSVGSVGR